MPGATTDPRPRRGTVRTETSRRNLAAIPYHRHSRRRFLPGVAGFILSTPGVLMATATTTSGPLTLAPLPYAESALEPVISAQTLGFHHGKHQKTYVETANKLIAGTELEDLPLDAIVRASVGKPDRVQIFNNAAQVWNHEFYWKSLTPRGGGEPPAELKRRIESAFGGVQACTKELASAATAQFGSGWVWLVADGAQLKVVKTADAETPFTQGLKPLLTIDVWEHAYYLDYQNRRADHVKAVIEKLLNWPFAAENLAKD
jgi:Fe-Mn family superoxide dismutase